MKLLDLTTSPILLEGRKKKKLGQTLTQVKPALGVDISDFLRERVVTLLTGKKPDAVNAWTNQTKWGYLKRRKLVEGSQRKGFKPTRNGLEFLLAVDQGKLRDTEEANQWIEDNKEALGLKKVKSDPAPQIKEESKRKAEAKAIKAAEAAKADTPDPDEDAPVDDPEEDPEAEDQGKIQNEFFQARQQEERALKAKVDDLRIRLDALEEKLGENPQRKPRKKDLPKLNDQRIAVEKELNAATADHAEVLEKLSAAMDDPSSEEEAPPGFEGEVEESDTIKVGKKIDALKEMSEGDEKRAMTAEIVNDMKALIGKTDDPEIKKDIEQYIDRLEASLEEKLGDEGDDEEPEIVAGPGEDASVGLEDEDEDEYEDEYEDVDVDNEQIANDRKYLDELIDLANYASGVPNGLHRQSALDALSDKIKKFESELGYEDSRIDNALSKLKNWISTADAPDEDGKELDDSDIDAGDVEDEAKRDEAIRAGGQMDAPADEDEGTGEDQPLETFKYDGGDDGGEDWVAVNDAMNKYGDEFAKALSRGIDTNEFRTLRHSGKIIIQASDVDEVLNSLGDSPSSEETPEADAPPGLGTDDPIDSPTPGSHKSDTGDTGDNAASPDILASVVPPTTPPSGEDKARTKEFLASLDKSQLLAMLSVFAQAQKFKDWRKIANLAQNVADPQRREYQKQYNKLMLWIKTGKVDATATPTFNFEGPDGKPMGRDVEMTLKNGPIPEITKQYTDEEILALKKERMSAESLLREAEEPTYFASFLDILDALIAKSPDANEGNVKDAFELLLGKDYATAQKEMDITSMLPMLNRYVEDEAEEEGDEEEQIDAGEFARDMEGIADIHRAGEDAQRRGAATQELDPNATQMLDVPPVQPEKTPESPLLNIRPGRKDDPLATQKLDVPPVGLGTYADPEEKSSALGSTTAKTTPSPQLKTGRRKPKKPIGKRPTPPTDPRFLRAEDISASEDVINEDDLIDADTLLEGMTLGK